MTYGRHQRMNGTRSGSWHVVETIIQYRGGPGFATLCGRAMLGPTASTFVYGEKTCEVCLRLVARAERA